MAITTEQIKELREATGAGILDCRKALEQAGGDFDKAVDFLREKGLATAAKRADRAAQEGKVELYSHGGGRVGVMVEVNCETDFVARSEAFRTFTHEVALQIAAAAPKYIRESEVPAEVMEHERGMPAPGLWKRANPKQSSSGSSKAGCRSLWMRFACCASRIVETNRLPLKSCCCRILLRSVRASSFAASPAGNWVRAPNSPDKSQPVRLAFFLKLTRSA